MLKRAVYPTKVFVEPFNQRDRDHLWEFIRMLP
jgi:hypothetical protein